VNANFNKTSGRSFLVMLFFPRRIGRGSFVIRVCVISILGYGVLSSVLLDSKVTASIFVLLVWIYGMFWVDLPRMRDLSMRPLWLILLLVPVLNVAFLLVLAIRSRPIAWPRSTETPENPGDSPTQPNERL
jgi:hypothetical protein